MYNKQKSIILFILVICIFNILAKNKKQIPATTTAPTTTVTSNTGATTTIPTNTTPTTIENKETENTTTPTTTPKPEDDNSHLQAPERKDISLSIIDESPIVIDTERATKKVRDFLDNFKELSKYIKDDVLIFIINHLSEVGETLINSGKKSIPQTYLSRLDYLRDRVEDYLDLMYPPQSYLGSEEGNTLNADADTHSYSEDVKKYLPNEDGDETITESFEKNLDNLNNFKVFSPEERKKFKQEEADKKNYGLNAFSQPIDDRLETHNNNKIQVQEDLVKPVSTTQETEIKSSTQSASFLSLKSKYRLR